MEKEKDIFEAKIQILLTKKEYERIIALSEYMNRSVSYVGREIVLKQIDSYEKDIYKKEGK